MRWHDRYAGFVQLKERSVVALCEFEELSGDQRIEAARALDQARSRISASVTLGVSGMTRLLYELERNHLSAATMLEQGGSGVGDISAWTALYKPAPAFARSVFSLFRG